MIRTLNRVLIGLVALAGFAGVAQAAYVPATWNNDITADKYIADGGSYQYTHYLTDSGFNLGSDLVTDFNLSIDLFDDKKDGWFELEAAIVDLPGLLGDALVFSFGNNAYNGWSIAGLLELNSLGTLTVTITSLFGDFVFGGSHLLASGLASTSGPATSVPEPSTLALLGLGLLGIAVGARRRGRKS